MRQKPSQNCDSVSRSSDREKETTFYPVMAQANSLIVVDSSSKESGRQKKRCFCGDWNCLIWFMAWGVSLHCRLYSLVSLNFWEWTQSITQMLYSISRESGMEFYGVPRRSHYMFPGSWSGVGHFGRWSIFRWKENLIYFLFGTHSVVCMPVGLDEVRVKNDVIWEKSVMYAAREVLTGVENLI